MSANTSFLLAVSVVLLFIATPAAAFGAGDIVDLAKINAVNYRHGDIENTLLELIMVAGGNKKFEKLDVKRVYFGNWLRDYSQAIDVGGLKQLPAETIRVLLWCLSFLTFGFATGEFEVTAERLGCYRPEEHIDNPKDYADNEDARQYDQRLRAPVNEEQELKVDPETGLKVYIASENAGCTTSSGLIRSLFEKSIELGRKYNRDHDKKDLYEALRLLGTGLHCLEDFSAHSNYTELALRELGVDAFPHVGKNTEMDVKGKKIFPLVTGTFGMTDFLHSVVGEMGDKVAQSEIEGLDSQLNQASQDDEKNDQTSVLKAILDKVPWDLLESDTKPDAAKADQLKEAAAAKKQETAAHPPDPNASLGGVNIEEAKAQAQQTLKDMYPILEFHDQVMKGVTEVISKVPGLDDLLENMTGALQIFVFSLLAPYVTPIIAHARVELKSTSEGVLKTSEKGQYEVFENDTCTDPTHSMLSKDHFSNVLNTIAGQIACATVKFAVPRIVDSWSDESKDVRQTIDDILQVFHHPALRDENREGQKAMFETVKNWWENKDESDKEKFKQILSFDGVKAGNNHEGESEEGGHGHSHGAPKKKKQENELVPSAQEGASVISDLTSGLGGMFLKKTGLDKKLGVDADNLGQSGRKNEESSYGQTQQSSYGGNSSGRNDNQESSYGSGGNTYGSSGRTGRQEQETSSYQSGNTYGQSRTSGRGDDNESAGNTYGSSGRSGRNDNEESSGNTYGSSGRSGRNDNDESSSNTYGSSGRSGRNHNEESSNTYGRNENTSSTYNQSGRSGRSNNEEETSAYDSGHTYGGGSGRSGRTDHEESSNTYGQSPTSGRDDNSESNTYGSSGRSGRNDNEESSYGSSGRSGRNNNEESSYGSGGNNYGSSGRDQESSNTYGSRTSGRGGGDNEESSYNSSSGNTHGSSRRDDNESSGYGGRSGGGRGEQNEESEYSQQREERGSGYGNRRQGDDENENSRY
ncbi:related to Het-c protein [Rhynchosporium agropyri]|uniref:Related to Het-c protein n=1 Tax=Rhynchosporium agropyri TaxID=914238 RepID=A0A1E1KG78_9HELO|nr:related to Het-c protein [Rhynchosporium agropyri]